MSTIITRSGKGSLLTPTEVDTNFNNLNTDKMEKSNNLSDVVSASSARGNLGFVSPILDKTAPGPIGETSPSTGKFSTLVATDTVGIGGVPFGQTLLVQSANTFDILDASTTAGVHVIGNGTSVVGAYGGALTLSKSGGSSRPGAGIASVQSTADADQCGLAFMVHGGSVASNQLQEAGGIDSGGLATFKSLSTEKVNVTSPTASDGNVYSGTYTPVLTTTLLNVAAGTAYECQYMRVGNVVTVSGRIDIDPTAAGRFTFGVSLPIASNIGAVAHCGGTFFAGGATTLNGGTVNGDNVNRANFDGVAQDTASRAYSFIFSYKVI